MPRFLALSMLLVSALSLSACALPQLPKLPKLPSASDVAAVLPVSSSGQSLKDAAAQAFAKADAWAPGATWVSLSGLKLDPGGRNGGHAEGVWIFTFQSDSKPKALELRVKPGAITEREPDKQQFASAPLNRDLAGLLDSPDAVAKSGLSVRSMTIVLRQATDAPIYNMVEEGGTTRAVLDARTGEKRPE
jgi:hypothetical protein